MKRVFLTASMLALVACSGNVEPIEGRNDIEAVLAVTPADTSSLQTFHNEVLSITPGLSVPEAERKLDAVDAAAKKLGEKGTTILAASRLVRAEKLHQLNDYKALETATQALEDLTALGLEDSAAALEAREVIITAGDDEVEHDQQLRTILNAKVELHGEASPRLADVYLALAGLNYAKQDFDGVRAELETVFELTENHTDDLRAVDTRIAAFTRQSSAYHDEGNAVEAINSAEAALALARDHFDDNYPRLGEVLANYGAGLYRGARHQEAVTTGREAIKRSQSQLNGKPSTSLGIAMVNLAAAEHGTGNHAGADEMFMAAYETFLEMGGETNLGYAGASLDNAAKAANDLGRLEEADQRYVDAQALLIEALGDDHINLSLSYLTHADTLYRLGDFERTQTVGTQAADILSKHIGEDNLYTRLARSTALLGKAELDPESVRDEVRRQTDQAEAVMRDAILSAEGWNQTTSNMRLSLNQLILTALTAGEMDAAFKALQINALSSVSEADHRRALSRSLDDTDGSELAETLKDTQQRRQTLRSQLTEALSQGGETGTLRTQLLALDTEIDTLSRQLFADGDTSALLGLSDLSDIQASLAEGEALLMPMSMFRAEGVMITQDEIYHSRGERDSALIRDANRAFAKTLASDDPITPDHPLLAELGQSLFNQVPMETITQISVVGQMPANSVPLSLVQDPANPDQFLGQRVALTRLPSAAALMRPAPDADSMKRGFLGIGDPAFDGAPQKEIKIASVGGLSPQSLMRGGEADLTAIRALPRLPETRTEVSAIADTLDPSRAKLLLGMEASEDQLRALDLTNYGVISLATHGLLSGEMSGLSEPALVLSPPASEDGLSSKNDGLLLASEIAELDMNARLVMLSACNSGRGLDSIVGLPQSFLTAGADALMVSRWPVRDDVARFLSVETVKAMQSGESPAESLRLAVNRLRASDLPGVDDPRIFAPFEIVGR